MVYTCELCNCGFETLRGLRIHQSRSCKGVIEVIKPINVEPLANVTANHEQDQVETIDILRCNEINILDENDIRPNLPEFVPV